MCSHTKLMGILNVTPDSFFDQGSFFDSSKAIARGEQIIQEGADILDIGGESSRPGSTSISEAEELRRIIPVIQSLRKMTNIPISVDTVKPRVAAAAIEAGATMINDISGARHPEMRKIAASCGVPICLMHMQGTPATMQISPVYPEGIISHLIHWFEEKIDLLIEAGVKKNNIILDPGIGFGKTVAHNLQIIHNLPQLKALGFPLLLGVSRKSFMSKIVNRPAVDLLPTTVAVNVIAIQNHVDIIRVHDIEAHRLVIDFLKEKTN